MGKGYGKDGMEKGKKGKMMQMMQMMMAAKGEKGVGKGAGMGKDGFGAGADAWQQGPQWDYKPGTYYEEPGGKVGVEGLKDAITRAVQPFLPVETQWPADDMINRVCFSIFKISAKWYKEETRHKETGTSIQAQALLEEFTHRILEGLQKTCYNKTWFVDIYLSEAIALAAINTFKGGALFNRTVAPIIVTHVDEAIFRWREEERHQRVMWDAVTMCGIKSDYQKKANKHLLSSFEAAHISAKYGTSPAITPELGMVQDFVQAWLSEFTGRAWDVLNNGIAGTQVEIQIQCVTALFQYLCDPNHSCLPHDLTSQLEQPPPPAWDFVAQATILLFSTQ